MASLDTITKIPQAQDNLYRRDYHKPTKINVNITIC